MTITEFLLARIQERADWAQEALDLSAGIGVTREWRWVRFYGSPDYPNNPPSSSFYQGAPDPARVLAECEAERRIVERCSAVDYAMPSTHLASGILAELAGAHADQPDYDEAWWV